MDGSSDIFFESTDLLILSNDNKKFKIYNLNSNEKMYIPFVQDNFVNKDDVIHILISLGYNDMSDINEIFNQTYPRKINGKAFNIIKSQNMEYISLFHVQLFIKEYHKLLVTDDNIDIYNSIVDDINNKSRRRQSDFPNPPLLLHKSKNNSKSNSQSNINSNSKIETQKRKHEDLESSIFNFDDINGNRNINQENQNPNNNSNNDTKKRQKVNNNSNNSNHQSYFVDD